MSAGGTKSAVCEAVGDAIAAREALEAAQLELLPTRFAGSTGREWEHSRVIEAVKRGRGRPSGAENKATLEVKAFVRRVFGDPLVERARWLLHTPESLAIELGCSKLEAFDRLEAIRESLQRVFYAPLAPVDEGGNVVPPQFNMVIGGRSTAAGDDARAPWLYAQETQQNQALPAPAPVVSDGVVSDGDAK